MFLPSREQCKLREFQVLKTAVKKMAVCGFLCRVVCYKLTDVSTLTSVYKSLKRNASFIFLFREGDGNAF